MDFLTKKKVALVVDDEASIRAIVKEYLLDFSIDVHEAEDGALGFLKYKKLRYEFLIIDMMMPKVSGIDLIKNIRAIDDKIKILVLTSCADREVIEEVLSQGVQGWILKPLDEESFKAKIQKLLA